MERILTLNIGATRLALAEFEVGAGKSPALLRYTFGELPTGLEASEDLSLAVEQVLRAMLANSGIRPGRINLALSGQMAFPRFVKVPADSPERMHEMVQFEVEQNVPFPLSEAVWSDASIGEPDYAGEQHVMIVAARSEIIDAISRALINIGCEPELVDVAPVAIYNATRFNYADGDGCTLVIDIGARCTNLVFVEAGRIFYRTIPVAGNTITSEIAKTFDVDVDAAEQFKCEQGLVAQGGAFAVDDPDVDRLSKVIRNVMARLNAEVMRSISFYRSQQEGEAPSRILLTGATSQLPYLQNFFEEKLQVPVDFLNPFQSVAYPKHTDEEIFGRDAFSLSVLVGLALRRSLTCPVEINLVSKELVERKIFRKRIPFFVISAVGLIAVALLWFFHFGKIASYYENELADDAEINVAQRAHDMRESEYREVASDYSDAKKRVEAYTNLLTLRGKWQNYINIVEKSLPDGYWLSAFEPKRVQNSTEPPTGVVIKVALWGEIDSTAKSGGSIVIDALKKSEAFDPESISLSRTDTSKSWIHIYTISADFAGAKKTKKKSRR